MSDSQKVAQQAQAFFGELAAYAADVKAGINPGEPKRRLLRQAYGEIADELHALGVAKHHSQADSLPLFETALENFENRPLAETLGCLDEACSQGDIAIGKLKKAVATRPPTRQEVAATAQAARDAWAGVGVGIRGRGNAGSGTAESGATPPSVTTAPKGESKTHLQNVTEAAHNTRLWPYGVAFVAAVVATASVYQGLIITSIERGHEADLKVERAAVDEWRRAASQCARPAAGEPARTDSLQTKDCPTGTELVGRAGVEQWCQQRSSGGDLVKSGPYRKWYAGCTSDSRIATSSGPMNSVGFEHLNCALELKGTYDAGKQNGTWEYFHRNGQLLQSRTVKDGVLEGVISEWYDNGQVIGDRTFEHDKVIGHVVRYHRNGLRHEEGDWVNGKQSGLHREWDETGHLTAEVTFNDGVEVGRTAIP